MVLGLDVGMEKVESLSSKALVRKFIGKVVKRALLMGWLEVGWKKLLGYCLAFIF
jgi:hypothetical protein